MQKMPLAGGKLSKLLPFLACALFAWDAGAAPGRAGLPMDFDSPAWKRAGLVSRLEASTQAWMGLPYLAGPLGEGPQGRYDRDPLVRLDGFDCVTFVETALSLAVSESESEFLENLRAIRYDHGQIDFVTRNHFTEVDWIPNNIREGWFEEVAPELESRGFPLAVAQARIDKRAWYRSLPLNTLQGAGFSETERLSLLPLLRAEGERFEPEISRMTYVPFTTWLDDSGTRLRPGLVDALPELAVVSMIRPGWNPGGASPTQLNVSHQGLLIKRGSQLYLRHATSDSRMRVVEDLLIDYVRRNFSSPTLKGLHVLRVIRH